LRLSSGNCGENAGQTLTVLDEMYIELKRREEDVRKRERDTLETYHHYMQNFVDLPEDSENRKAAMKRFEERALYASPMRPTTTSTTKDLRTSRYNVEKGRVKNNVMRFNTGENYRGQTYLGRQPSVTPGVGHVKNAAEKYSGSGPTSGAIDADSVIRVNNFALKTKHIDKKNPPTFHVGTGEASIAESGTAGPDDVLSSTSSQRKTSVPTSTTMSIASGMSGSGRSQSNSLSDSALHTNESISEGKAVADTEQITSIPSEKDLFLKAQEKAALAERDGKLEESNLKAELEERKKRMIQNVLGTWQRAAANNDEDSISANSFGNSTFGDGSITTFQSQTTGNQSVVFVTDAEMKLSNFIRENRDKILALARDENGPYADGTDVSFLTGTEEDDTSVGHSEFSSTLMEYNDAVEQAERAAKEMASAVARATASTSSVASYSSQTTRGSRLSSTSASIKKRRDSTKSSPSKKKSRWVQYWSEEHAKEYYFNPRTNTVQWERPEGAIIDDSNKANARASVSDLHTGELDADDENENSDSDAVVQLTEKEKLQASMRNWTLDEFLPDRKPLVKKKSRSSKRSSSSKKKSSKSRGFSILNEESSYISTGTKGSKGSKRSTRSSRSTGSNRSRNSMTLTETVVAIASPPSDEKSLWNKRNRKARKRVIRRSIWTLVISTALYKTATHFRGQQQPSHDISHDDIPSEITIPAASQMDGTNMNKGTKKEKDKRSKLQKQEEELRRKQREKDKFKSLDDFTATKAKPSPKKKKKTKTAKEEKIELAQNISVEIPIQKEPIQEEEKVEVDRSSNAESASGDSVTDSSPDNISISISSSPKVPEIPEVSLIVEESTTNTKTVELKEEVEEKVTQYHLQSRPKRCSIPILKGLSKNMCQEYDKDKSGVSFPRKKLHFDFSEDDLVDLLFITGIGKYQKTKPHEKMIEEENVPGIDSTTGEADNKHIACLFPFADLLVPECRADSTKTGTQIDSNII